MKRTTGDSMYYSIYYKDHEAGWVGQVDENGKIHSFIPLDIDNKTVVPNTMYYSIVEEDGDDFKMTNLGFERIDPEIMSDDGQVIDFANYVLSSFRSRRLH